jgi:hypothetical protein
MLAESQLATTSEAHCNLQTVRHNNSMKEPAADVAIDCHHSPLVMLAHPLLDEY